MSFEGWLAKLLGHDEQDVRRLLQDKMALHFLMAWSLYESKLFGGYVKLDNIDAFCKRIVEQEGLDASSIAAIAEHFHARYQDTTGYHHLMHTQVSPLMDAILKKPFDSLSGQEITFVVAITVYRYRNNIFHGNKRVNSWLTFRPQIRHCVNAMQAFVDHAEQRLPSLQTPATA